MKKEISAETQKLVLDELEKLGEYDSVEYLGEWGKYSVFVPTFKDLSSAPIIGFPPYFIVKDNKLKSVMYGIDKRYDAITDAFN